MKNSIVEDAGCDPLGRFLPPNVDARLINHYLVLLAESEARLRSDRAVMPRPERPTLELNDNIAEIEGQFVLLREKRRGGVFEQKLDVVSPVIKQSAPAPAHSSASFFSARPMDVFVNFNRISRSNQRVLRWSKRPGDFVLKGDLLVEIGPYRIFAPVAGLLEWTLEIDGKLVVSPGDHLATISRANSTSIKMPGAPNCTSQIQQWLKVSGSAVLKGEVIGFSNDMKIEAPCDGVVKFINYPLGARLLSGTEIALVQF